MNHLDLNCIRHAMVSKQPYFFLTGQNFLKPESINGLRRDFPQLTKPGYLTVDDISFEGEFKTLIKELESPELTEELSRKFGLDLHPYPRLTTIMRHSRPKHGAIHTDGESKVATLLLYMNDTWNVNDGGCLRVFYNDKDYESWAVEIPPVMGTVFAFVRAENSWHGHKPFSGERKAIQVAWLRSHKDKERKRKRNSVTKFFKGIFNR